MDILRTIVNNRKNLGLISGFITDFEPKALKLNIEKFDSLLKLVYKMFLLSIVGFLVKSLAKFFKL